MGRPKRSGPPPPPGASADELREWFLKEQLRQHQREAHGRSPRGDRQRNKEQAAAEQAERANTFAASAAATRERLTKGDVAELLRMADEDPDHVHVTCYDDDPVMMAILAGEITNEAERREARGLPPS